MQVGLVADDAVTVSGVTWLPFTERSATGRRVVAPINVGTRTLGRSVPLESATSVFGFGDLVVATQVLGENNEQRGLVFLDAVTGEIVNELRYDADFSGTPVGDDGLLAVPVFVEPETTALHLYDADFELLAVTEVDGIGADITISDDRIWVSTGRGVSVLAR